MLKNARVIGSIAPIGVGLALAWTGCAQVFGIDDWEEGGAGGRGGDGSQTSAASMTTSSGSGVQVTAASASVGSGGQGGQADMCDGMCVSPVPTGWQGYVAAVITSKGVALPVCDSGWPSQMDYKTGDLNAPPAMCGGCGCSAPMGGHCNLTQVNIGVYGDQTCTIATSSTSVSSPSCVGVSAGMLASLRVKLTGQSLPSNSGCLANGAPPLIQPASFDNHARLCGGPVIATGCSDGRQCVPKLPDQFAYACIYQKVDDNTPVDCPMGYNPAPELYENIMDTRGCSACTCGPPVAQNCEMSAQIFQNPSCTAGGTVVVTYPGTCSGPFVPTNGLVSAIVSPGTPQGGSCNPSTPNPTGSAYGTGRTVVCCLP